MDEHTEKLVWLLAFHAQVSSGKSVAQSAAQADKALDEFEWRFKDAPDADED